jgi:hypothetical protein
MSVPVLSRRVRGTAKLSSAVNVVTTGTAEDSGGRKPGLIIRY